MHSSHREKLKIANDRYVNAKPERRYVVFARDGPEQSLGTPVVLEPTRPGKESAVGGVSPHSDRPAKYGFYLHVYKPAAAVLYQVKQIKKFFPGAPIYIMSDGGDRFDGLCQKEGCTFKLCPPANDRWHPWPFFNRFYHAAVALKYVYRNNPAFVAHSAPIELTP